MREAYCSRDEGLKILEAVFALNLQKLFVWFETCSWPTFGKLESVNGLKLQKYCGDHFSKTEYVKVFVITSKIPDPGLARYALAKLPFT